MLLDSVWSERTSYLLGGLSLSPSLPPSLPPSLSPLSPPPPLLSAHERFSLSRLAESVTQQQHAGTDEPYSISVLPARAFDKSILNAKKGGGQSLEEPTPRVQ
jgi:hypothetical protein